MRADKQFRRLGFIKSAETDFTAQYDAYDEMRDCVHRIVVDEYEVGEYFAYCYDYDLKTKEHVDTFFGLLEEEMQACLKKIKEIKRRNRQ